MTAPILTIDEVVTLAGPIRFTTAEIRRLTDQPREIAIERIRHARECPCAGRMKGHKTSWYGGHSPQEAIGYRRWMDHLSTTKQDGRKTYICQPYSGAAWGIDLEAAHADWDLLRSLGWTVLVSDNSPHAPGGTILVTLIPPVRTSPSAVRPKKGAR